MTHIYRLPSSLETQLHIQLYVLPVPDDDLKKKMKHVASFEQ
jgi:hypothetical protein